MPRPARTVSANLAGIVTFAASLFLISTSDMLAKRLTGEIHPVQVVWMRQSGLVLVALALLATRGAGLLRAAAPGLQLMRGFAATLSALAFIAALRFVPLADAVAVSFVAPFMVAVLGAVFLRETVSGPRWAAIVGGFLGAIVIIRPGPGMADPAILLVVAGAFFLALRQVLGRPLAARATVATTLVWTAMAGFVPLTLLMPLVWRWPTPEIWLIGAAIAGLIAAAEALLIRAFATAEATAIAPVLYTAMIWATGWGWLVFGQLPDLWTWIGTAVILATGLALIRLEMRQAPPSG